MRVPCFPPTCHYDTDAQKRTRSMRITPAPINTIPFFIALLVTGMPLAVGPATVLLIEFSGDQHGGYEGLVMLGAILTMGIIASAYAAVVSIIGFALLRMLKKRSLGLGVLYGLGTGAAIGATLVILAMAVV